MPLSSVIACRTPSPGHGLWTMLLKAWSPLRPHLPTPWRANRISTPHLVIVSCEHKGEDQVQQDLIISFQWLNNQNYVGYPCWVWPSILQSKNIIVFSCCNLPVCLRHSICLCSAFPTCKTACSEPDSQPPKMHLFLYNAISKKFNHCFLLLRNLIKQVKLAPVCNKNILKKWVNHWLVYSNTPIF